MYGVDTDMINIITVGKIKEKYIIDGINEYLKRLAKYAKVNLIELSDDSFDKVKTLKSESERILSKLDLKSFIVTLEIDGKELNSMEFSELIDKTLTNYSDITFIIGGSNGIHDSIKNIVNYKLSFSKMTFPHQLIRVFLLEQIFRAFKISNGETYHR